MAGEAAIAAGRRILAELDGLERRLAGEDLRPSGWIRLTTTDTLVALLTPLLADFRRLHPAIHLELVTANDFFTLTRRDADVALRPAVAAPEGLVARRLADIATAVYAAAGQREWQGAEDLAQADWLAPDETLAHLPAARWLKAEIPEERIVYRASSLLALAEAARSGLGQALLPCFLGDADPALQRLQPPLPQLASALWLITHPDLRRVARIRAFLDFAAAALTRQRALFEGRESRAVLR